MRKVIFRSCAFLILIGCDKMATTKAHFAVTTTSASAIRVAIDAELRGPEIVSPGAKFDANIKVPDNSGGVVELNPAMPNVNDRITVNVSIVIVDPATNAVLAGPIMCPAGGEITTHVEYDPGKQYDKLRCWY